MRPPLLHRRCPELVGSLPFLRLGAAPTPVRALPGAGTRAELWVKDESGYGDGGWGGNKVRKLEWLLPEARRRGARTLLTVGGLGTNWGLAAARYAREQGLEVVLGLIDHPVDEHVRGQLERLRASGASLHFPRTKTRLMVAAPWLFVRHFHGATPPYYLPAGGSSPLGALGAVEIALELGAQVEAGELPEPAWLVTPVGSGGTTAGLALGLRLAGLRTRVLGVVVNDTLRLDSRALLALARRSAALLRARGADVTGAVPGPDAVRVETAWLGDGYAHPTAAGDRALALASARTGLTLERTYTAKAFAALLALDARGGLAGGPVVFLQTHGPR
ncbi:pyridoxal-phosphate dependent enzyme [Streptomyces sp. SP18ES09]|uniref:1-aminocyclopropane-1-carboxylate deaminase/D-cysteine desulfhydrase n=1 Tax=Streptomyces sp. SP18ES09 TaxID=3002532 RepID=UPI002E7A80AF|nr:pyridoxal-phosphate dependent enzyme [Streptomyces sp. SP18ES09]MEE1816747.1 pyridoxal-phosphate dependent enzyme [Streptomyces sp. SP18ES09]